MTTKSRIVLGFSLAPLVTALWFVITALVLGSGPFRLGDAAMFFAIPGVFAYAATLVFRVPAFFLYRWLKIRNSIFFIIGGGLIGVMMSRFMSDKYSLTYLPLHLWFALPGA